MSAVVTKLPGDAPAWAVALSAQLAQVQQSIDGMGAAVQPRQELTTKAAMARLGYQSTKRFWEAVRRLGIPYSKISSQHVVFDSADITAALEAKRVGVRRPVAGRAAA